MLVLIIIFKRFEVRGIVVSGDYTMKTEIYRRRLHESNKEQDGLHTRLGLHDSRQFCDLDKQINVIRLQKIVDAFIL
jgi:hypothetical protein